MSAITNSNYSTVAYSNANMGAAQGKTQAEQTTSFPYPLPPAPKDIYMPGTDENDTFQTYTHYHQSGGIFRFGAEPGKSHEQTYMAVTFIAEPGPGANSNYPQGHLTAGEIDKSQPGVVYSNGHWIPVAEYFADEKQTEPATDNSIAVEPETETLELDLNSDERKVDPNTVTFSLRRLMASPGQLSQNPGLLWTFTDPNSAFQGHDILNGIFDKVYSNLESREPVVDEYGFTYNMPGWTPNEDFTVWSSSNDEEGQPQQTINSSDASNFYGLTLDERDRFWAEVQTIFDKNGVDLDARKESYGYTSSDTPGCDDEFALGGWSWDHSDLDAKTVRKIQKELAENTTIRGLYEKGEQVRKGEITDDTLAQQYSIRVTDFDGNALAKDRIIIEAKNGNHVEMSVDDFKQLDRKSITALLG